MSDTPEETKSSGIYANHATESLINDYELQRQERYKLNNSIEEIAEKIEVDLKYVFEIVDILILEGLVFI